MNRNHTLFSAGLAAALALGCGRAANAGIIPLGTVVNFDLTGGFGLTAYTGQGAAGGGGTTWNTTTNALGPNSNNNVQNTYTYTGVVDSNGNPTSVGFSFDNQGGGYDNSVTPDTNPTDAQTLLQPYAFDYYNTGDGSSSDPTFSITGLESGGLYDVYVYAINGTYANRGTNVTIGSTTLSTANTQNTSFVAGNNYVEFTNVAADNTGSITGTYLPGTAPTFGGNGEADFNGLQLVAVPEPTTLGIFGAGLASLLLLKRRRTV